MKFKRKIGLILLACALVLCVIGVKWLFFTPPAVSSYLTAPVSVADIEDTVLASGAIQAKTQISVGAQVSGQLESLKVRLGDTVRQGQLIAQIDSLPQQNALLSAEAALADVRAQYRAEQATLALDQSTLTRQQSLLVQDAGSRADQESALANQRIARATLDQLRAQITEARIAVDTARVNLGYTRIVAPIAGTVVAVVTKQGQTVNASQSAPTIVKLAQLARVTVKAQISEADIPRVKVGQKAYFTILGAPTRHFDTWVRAIEPATDAIDDDDTSTTSTSSTTSTTSTAIYYNALMDVPNADGVLRISMTAQVHILLAQAHHVPSIPASALGERLADGRYQVQVLRADGSTQWRNVRIGLNNHVSAQVIDGLKLGEAVILGNSAVASVSSQDNHPPGAML